MSPVLDVDIGNTRVKWRLVSGAEEVTAGFLSIQPCSSDRVPEWADGTVVRVSSVLDSVYTRKSLERLGASALPLIEARVESPCNGLTCGYANPERFGVDRWLAMLAARSRWPGRALVVADAGSALTVDLVSAEGRHLGGYLVPGIAAQKNALATGTARVRFDASDTDDLSPGTSTDACVHRGIILALVALIREARATVEEFAGSEATLCITGGDRAILSPYLTGAVEVENLVLDGLAIAYPIP